jgi:hypothetical protein
METLIFGMLCAGENLMSIPISTKYQLQASRIDKYLGFSHSIESTDLIIILVLLQHECHIEWQPKGCIP